MSLPSWMGDVTAANAEERAALGGAPGPLAAGCGDATAPTGGELAALRAALSQPRRAPVRTRGWVWAGAVAVVAAALLLLPRGGQQLGPSIELSGNHESVVTERPDGFDVELAAGTLRANVDPGGARRNLRVLAGDVTVSVKGTVFEVRRDGARVEVTVQRGLVEVERGGDRSLVTAGESWPRAESVAVGGAVSAADLTERASGSPSGRLAVAASPLDPAAAGPSPADTESVALASADPAHPGELGAGATAPVAAPPEAVATSAADPRSARLSASPANSIPVSREAAGVLNGGEAGPATRPPAPEPADAPATDDRLALATPNSAPPPASGAEAWLGLLARLEVEAPSADLLRALDAWRSSYPSSPLAGEAELAWLELLCDVRPSDAAPQLDRWLSANPRHAAASRVQTLRLRRLEAEQGCGVATDGWLELAESTTGVRRAEAQARAGLCLLDVQPLRARRLLRAARPDLDPTLDAAVRARLEASP